MLGFFILNTVFAVLNYFTGNYIIAMLCSFVAGIMLADLVHEYSS